MTEQGRNARKQIGQILLEKGLIGQEQLDEALKIKQQTEEKLGQVLIDLGYITERDFLGAWAEQIGIPFVDLDEAEVVEVIAKALPRSVVQRYNALAIRRDDENRRLTVAMVDPTNVFALDDIRLITGYEIDPVLVSSDQFSEKLKSLGQDDDAQRELQEALEALDGDIGAALDESLEVPGEPSIGSEEAPIVRTVNVIILQALRDRAEAIHIIPDGRGVKVKYRIDGVLHEVMRVPGYTHEPIIQRLKVMAAECDITRQGLPQDGIFRPRFDGRSYALRVNITPTIWGEMAQIIVHPSDYAGLTFVRMGMLEETLSTLREPLASPGLFLFYGSRVVTKRLLGTALSMTVSSNTAALAIEASFDATVVGVEYVQADPKKRLTIPALLQHSQRLDLDIVMVGDIPDPETAQQLVMFPDRRIFAGLSALDSHEVLFSMIQGFRVHPFLLASRLGAVVGCKMVRKPCKNCSGEKLLTRHQIEEAGLPLPVEPEGQQEQVFKSRSSVGCEKCRWSGYYDRTGVFEVVLPDADLVERITKFPDLPPDERKQAIVQATVWSFKQDALSKLLSGQTTFEEVLLCLK